ncbi:hypothetical protein [Yoonia litorea]|uniref:Uncharacterized protein n=1 Tax=Yoonia litorea TaxID=1123755 RepID=A0A1I6MCN2_9RHOB|nr:hypothetical protein [Yoonia litorea]SFS13464.1 hypothetical protein SAMN05444714_1551 [Yoonia litorea]
MLGFIVAFIAGLLVPKIEETVTAPVKAFLQNYFKVEPAETRAISFMIALLGAAVISALLESGSTFAIALGVVLGYFGTRLYALIKRVIEARTDSD